MKRYRDYNTYLQEIFGERVQKIPLDAGLSCPNRDGTLSSEGCIYCDARGSGTGAFSSRGESIVEQIEHAKNFLVERYGARKFIAYFQSFTNTYGPLGQLKELYDAAVSRPDMVGLSVATRPDCVDREKLRLLRSYRPGHLVWVEFGLQSSHDGTLRLINRGHDSTCFKEAVRSAKDCDLSVCAHIILGLPGETSAMMVETARFLADLPIDGIKIHSLYVLQGTVMGALFNSGRYEPMTRARYVETVVEILEVLPPGLVIQRLTGDPPRTGLLAPLWTLEKQKNLNMIRNALERKNTWQGRLYG
ncbi:TIGR01212 family radical SAM protein [Desulfatiglans anilini]|uniref:TIGR01212 family radical SAM protein n=1 Tax=Desulfatiglans anilini TaxID=90728 RepID=UPI000414F481|nr:TIGR01212 family radical SAM protein [Desulfatiglans anilini]